VRSLRDLSQDTQMEYPCKSFWRAVWNYNTCLATTVNLFQQDRDRTERLLRIHKLNLSKSVQE
jgi:hypothetical protein